MNVKGTFCDVKTLSLFVRQYYILLVIVVATRTLFRYYTTLFSIDLDTLILIKKIVNIRNASKYL